MHRTQKLTRIFRELLTLVEKEAEKNPMFAEQLEAITTSAPRKKNVKAKRPGPAQPPPDVFAAFEQHGETEFRFWLRSHELPMLKAIIKANGYDPGKVSRRWSEPDKFINLIIEQTIARLRRGSAFLPPKAHTSPEGR